MLTPGGRTYGHTHERTNGLKTGSLYRAMPRAGATKNSQDQKTNVSSKLSFVLTANRHNWSLRSNVKIFDIGFRGVHILN